MHNAQRKRKREIRRDNAKSIKQVSRDSLATSKGACPSDTATPRKWKTRRTSPMTTLKAARIKSTRKMQEKVEGEQLQQLEQYDQNGRSSAVAADELPELKWEEDPFDGVNIDELLYTLENDDQEFGPLMSLSGSRTATRARPAAPPVVIVPAQLPQLIKHNEAATPPLDPPFFSQFARQVSLSRSSSDLFNASCS